MINKETSIGSFSNKIVTDKLLVWEEFTAGTSTSKTQVDVLVF
jgi:hypothetical protein